jgi:hypothetical protein
VLESVMGLPEETVTTICYYKELKDLSVFRRYAAKFISEYEMFRRRPVRRPALCRDHGPHHRFYHQPESHLFDLVPEFYCADYLLGWLGEAVLNDHMVERFGDYGCLEPDSRRMAAFAVAPGQWSGYLCFLRG